MELLEDINDYPLIIKPLDLPDYLIPNLVDQLGNKLDSLGDLQLVYSSPTSNRLRNFIIDIPKTIYQNCLVMGNYIKILLNSCIIIPK